LQKGPEAFLVEGQTLLDEGFLSFSHHYDSDLHHGTVKMLRPFDKGAAGGTGVSPVL
jgi:hypothetical protein